MRWLLMCIVQGGLEKLGCRHLQPRDQISFTITRWDDKESFKNKYYTKITDFGWEVLVLYVKEIQT